MNKKGMPKPGKEKPVKSRDPLMKRLKSLWEKHWEIIIVAFLAFIVGKFILPMFFK